MKKTILFILINFTSILLFSQHDDSTKVNNQLLDSLYIFEVQDKFEKDKVLHAEPLYIDLIRDLGARKGEKEWNIGMGISDNKKYDEYIALVEYEFAPIDRLGLEIEVPLTLYNHLDKNNTTDTIPGSKINSVKLAGQYSFFVNEKIKTSLAIGYIHEFEMTEFRNYSNSNLFNGNVFNPFFIAAKRWGNNFHTLIYTGPMISKHFNSSEFDINFQINTNFHYMIPGTRNFLGIEFNKEIYHDGFKMVMRPQMRVGVTDNLLIGIVAGIPLTVGDERVSSFVRLIYEPGHKVAKKFD